MKLLVCISILVVLGVSSLTEAAIRCEADTCSKMTCDPNITQEKCIFPGQPAGRFEWQPKGGVCGCCPLCMTFLDAGENCQESLARGGKPNKQCKQGLTCDSSTGLATAKCIKSA